MKMPLRLLLVEDSEDDALLLVQALRRGGYEPSWERVETAEAMRAALDRQRWDVVFTDHSMPHFSAPGALDVLRQSGHDTPLLLVSGQIEAEQAVGLLKAGARDYVNKNDLTRLAPAVARELGQVEVHRQRQRAEAQLGLLGVAVSAAANAVFITDSQGVIQWINAAFTRLSGYSPEEVIGNTPRVLKSGVQDPSTYEEMWQTILAGKVWAGDVVERRKDGSLYTVHQTITPLVQPGGSISHFIAIHEDITRRKEAEARVEYLAYHDPLTGLLNRTLLQDRLAQALSHARRNGRLVALHFLDLDKFKRINDTLGHAAGDLLLKQVAERLQHSLRSTDSVGRLGGDEFAIIQTDLASVDGAAQLADKVLQNLARPFTLNGQEIRVPGSIGIALYPLDDPDGQRLLENADMAQYQAKAEGGNHFAFFTPALNAAAQARQDVEVGLGRALTNGQLVLRYQPQVDLRRGTIVGMEALVRWQHPTQGLLLPASFLPVAEASGLILSLSDLVLKQGCAQNRAWQEGATAGRRVAINISAAHLRDELLLKSVTDALASTGLEPEHLELELTESALIKDEQAAIRVLRELHQLGILISIDDFGTGYSSLRYLKQLPIRKLKIDQSFVCNLPHDPDDATIVRATIQLGHELGLRVIAEGVERSEQLTFLGRQGCDEGQGCFFYPPLTPEAIEALLEAAADPGPRCLLTPLSV